MRITPLRLSIGRSNDRAEERSWDLFGRRVFEVPFLGFWPCMEVPE